MDIRTFREEADIVLLGSARSTGYTFTGIVFPNFERAVVKLTTHASINVSVFNVAVATSAAGAGATNLFTSVATTTADRVYTLEISPSVITAGWTHFSPIVTLSAGTYTLEVLYFNPRVGGNILPRSASYVSGSGRYSAPA